MAQLLDSEKIIPCNWQDSPVGQRLNDGSMPPPESSQPLMPLRAQQQLAIFVESMCTELLYPGNYRLVLAQRALVESCGSCHGPAAAGAAALPRLDDAAALIDQRFLIPCRSQASPIVLAIQSGSMPPPESGVPPMSARQLDALTDFIDGPCAR